VGARCIPEEPRFDKDHGAEETVWRALREQLPDDAVLLHSIALQDGPDQREVDLLVAWPGHGMAVVEVKGGAIRCTDGVWAQSGNAMSQSPIEQANAERHLLHSYLKKRGCSAAGTRIAHLVAFPGTRVPADWAAPACPRTMVVDRDDLDHAADVVRSALELHGKHSPFPDVDELVDCVTAPLVGQQELLSVVWEVEQQWDRFTEDQKRVARQIRHLDRLQVRGGAGSGKTFVAMHLAREHARDGKRVALVCYSRGLARFFEREAATWPVKERPAYVGLFHRLPVDWGAPAGADDDSDYWESQLPDALLQIATAKPQDELFDTVVIDEGQDFGESWWPATEALLRKGSRGLYVFLDEAQRVFARHGAPPLDLQTYPLEENLRNTRRIAQTFGSLTATGISKARGPQGPPVVFLQCPAAEAQDVADDAVAALVDEPDWSPGDIALLSTRHRHPVHQQAFETKNLDAYWDDFFAGTDVFYGHVLGFKGLERPVVVLAANGFRDLERAKEMLYVGLSRARALLVVCGDLAEITAAGGEGVRRRLESAASAITA
jgi:hypothetical protein